MKKTYQTLLLLLFISSSFAQTQVGVDINGKAGSDQSGTAVALSQNGSVMVIG